MRALDLNIVYFKLEQTGGKGATHLFFYSSHLEITRSWYVQYEPSTCTLGPGCVVGLSVGLESSTAAGQGCALK